MSPTTPSASSGERIVRANGVDHGEALAREIPGARLVPLDGVGHEIPPRLFWDLVVREILEHTADREAPRAPHQHGGTGAKP